MIIGLSGYARCGKDTVAKVLIDGYNFERVAFADPLRDMLLKIDPILFNGRRLTAFIDEYGWELAKGHYEVRRLLQTLGVAARNVIDSDVWVNAAVAKIEAITSNCIITDVRFENEAQKIKDLGGQVWRVERPGIKAINEHISESNLDSWEFDRYIRNTGTLEDLEFLVKMEMQSLL